MSNHRKTDITPDDHLRLKLLLLSKPREALREFRSSQINCLAELELFWEIVCEHPNQSYIIVIEAAEMGIPVYLLGMEPIHLTSDESD